MRRLLVLTSATTLLLVMCVACDPATPSGTGAPGSTNATETTPPTSPTDRPSDAAPAASIPVPVPFWYRDADGDGFGDANDSVAAADQPSGYVANQGDCDDADPTVNRAASEVPGDSVDNDCDGTVD